MYQVAVYDSTTMVSVIESDPKTAWAAAVGDVRARAHGAGQSNKPEWYRSGPRECYQIGRFRALPVRAR